MFDLSPEEITSGPLHRALAILSLPLLVQNLVRVAQNVIDLFWLGRLGGDAVAAVGIAYPTIGLILMFGAGITFIGTQVRVSQLVGADDLFGARKTAFNGLALAVVFGLVFGVVSYFAAPTLIGLMTSTQPQSAANHVTVLAIQYFQILALGMAAAASTDAIEAAFVAHGDSRAAFHINVISVVVNVTADPILIFGVGPAPALGIEGAALATVLGYTSAVLVGLTFILRGRSGGVLSRDALSLDLGEFREIIDIGLPPAAQRANRRLAEAIIVVIVFAAGGAAGITAYILGTRIASAAIIPANGLQSATQSVVGQNLGANEPGRAARTTGIGVAFVALLLTPVAVVQYAMSGGIVNLLAPDLSSAAFETTVQFLHILAYGYPAFGAVYVLQGGFNGASRSRVSFVTSIFQYWVVQLPIAALGGVILGQSVVAVFWAATIGNVLTAIALGLYYYYSMQSGMFDTASEEVEANAAS